MNINVTVEDVTLDTVVREFYDGDEGRVRSTIADVISAVIVERLVEDKDHWKPFREQVLAVRDDEIRATVTPLITEALNSPLQKTNTYGEPTGAATTLREVIAAEARKMVTQRADQYGRNGETVLQKLVREQVQQAFAKEVADEVAKARQMVSGQIGDMVAAAINEGLRKR